MIRDNAPVSCIKFDASFIKDPDQKRSRIVLKKMVELAEELGIDTIVEGVENADQLLALREISCAAAQGYYFGQPLLLFSIFAPLTSAFKRSLGYYSVASILFAVLQMQEEMQLTVLFGHYHVWRLFTYPVMVLLPFLLIMTINASWTKL